MHIRKADAGRAFNEPFVGRCNIQTGQSAATEPMSDLSEASPVFANNATWAPYWNHPAPGILEADGLIIASIIVGFPP
jgi:hypothetical protein